MAGVVRRDGLREAVSWSVMHLRGNIAATRDDDPIVTVAKEDLARVLDAVPDVPPDPPAAEVSE